MSIYAFFVADYLIVFLIIYLCVMLKIQVIDYYSKKGNVANLHAEKPPKDVTAEVQKVLS